jgi:protein-L-isoaspartate(D-aspartate) O-methyltransferase
LLKSGRLRLFQGDGWEGLKHESPFDCIHVGAAAVNVPRQTLAQLTVGGFMLIPVGPEGEEQDLLLVSRIFSSLLFSIRLITMTMDP